MPKWKQHPRLTIEQMRQATHGPLKDWRQALPSATTRELLKQWDAEEEKPRGRLVA